MSRPIDLRFQEHTECVICLNDFTESDRVTPLPCDRRHYFHTECIKQWAKQKQYCPLCNVNFTQQQLEEHNMKFSQNFRPSMFKQPSQQSQNENFDEPRFN